MKRIRCGIYTRKSTEEGLEQEFNTLDAQREAGEAYIKSQLHEGWECLPDRYDDGGFTGGNMERPALKRLMADITAGKVDCVLVYKVDRLSRSLLDFGRIMEVFDKQHVSFVSVTQLFNTSTSMGRLMLNVLLSFAQFEREIISERTRDKIAATRRKGKWSGGLPVLGYDVVATKLVVNAEESARVRTIFELYLEHQALLPVVAEVRRRGWLGKRWTTSKGKQRGGKEFTKTSLHKVLTNVTYIGQIKYKTQMYQGEHEAIVGRDLWQRVQTTLARNGRSGSPLTRNQFGAILKGILHCSCCDCAMSPTHSTKGNKRYRYYVCTNAQKSGWASCPTKSLPAQQIERFVIDEIKRIGHDPSLIAETVIQAQQQARGRTLEREAEQRALERDVGHWAAELATATDVGYVADLRERIATAERRATQVREELIALEHDTVESDEVARALAEFDPVWEALTPREQAELLQLLVERVDYNGSTVNVTITFHPTGIKTLAERLGVAA